MHRGSRLLLDTSIGIKTKFLVLVFLFLEVQCLSYKNLYVADGNSDYTQGCELLACKNGEECVNRKFWCKHSPCPTMTYCSKSKKESLKGPENCDSVSCDVGYKCLVRTRGCKWNPSFTRTNCKERMARCVSEWEFQNSPASCADVDCPMGYRCILRESHCYQVPCRLTRSCVQARDVKTWFERCKQLGCPSEEQCFLRKPEQMCTTPPCTQSPDCLNKEAMDVEDQSINDYCVGWICPPNQKCSANYETPCRQENCRITRTCQDSVMQTYNLSRSGSRPLDIISPQRTLTHLEKEAILDENRKLHNFMNPTSVSNNTTVNWMRASRNFNAVMPTRVSMSHKNPDFGSKKEQYVSPIPSIRSTSFGELPWLTYFKKKAGAQTVQYWIEKSKRNDNYEGFVDWLDTVADLLDADTYRLWFRELESISDDIPEFKTWITHYNFRPRASVIYNRELHSDPRPLRTSTIEEPRKTHPGSYKTPSYYDNLFTQEPPMHGPGPGIHDAHASGSKPAFENTRSEERRVNPSSNFNFNEIRQYEDAPEFRSNIYNPLPTPVTQMPPHRPFYNPPHQMPVQDSGLADYGRTQPDSTTPHYKNNNMQQLWNSWTPPYYQFNPMKIPQFAFNYTQDYLNKNFIPNMNFQNQRQDIPIFYPPQQPKYQEGMERAINQNPQWSIPNQLEDFQAKPYKGENENVYKYKYDRSSKENAYSKPNNPASMDVEALMNQIAGLTQLGQTKNNGLNVDPDQGGPRFLLPPNGENSNLPKLLIYFPPPLNFFIYYSVKNQNQSKSDNSKNDPNRIDTRMIVPWDDAKFNMSKFQETMENKMLNIEKNSEANKYKKENKQKEFEYIRKIIRELIEYWDDEEKIFELTKEEDYENTAFDNNLKTKDEGRIENQNYERNIIDVSSTKATFNSFLEWLTKNRDYKDMLDQKSRRKKPLVYTSENQASPPERSLPQIPSLNPSLVENAEDKNAKKVRILVDIDKNPDVMQAFFQRHSHAHSNKSDTHEYQITVNLQDFFDPKEEDVISRKLMEIASNQLHKNLTNNQKLPKTLFVFPIYEDEENDTLINELESNTQQLNGLDDEATTLKNDSYELQNIRYNKELSRGKKENSMKNNKRSNDNNKSDKLEFNGSKKNTENRRKSSDRKQNKRKNDKNKVKQP